MSKSLSISPKKLGGWESMARRACQRARPGMRAWAFGPGHFLFLFLSLSHLVIRKTRSLQNTVLAGECCVLFPCSSAEEENIASTGLFHTLLEEVQKSFRISSADPQSLPLSIYQIFPSSCLKRS